MLASFKRLAYKCPWWAKNQHVNTICGAWRPRSSEDLAASIVVNWIASAKPVFSVARVDLLPPPPSGVRKARMEGSRRVPGAGGLAGFQISLYEGHCGPPARA
jgi:hypothetical protein